MERPSTSSRYPFPQDAIRIQVQSPSGGGEGAGQYRRFSVDPSLTDFSILRNLIGRAFDLKRDFIINYRVLDDLGGETYLPMVSDWDLSAAFLSASDPDLQLMIEPRDVPLDCDDSLNSDQDREPSWELIKSDEVVQPSPLPIPNHHRRTLGTVASTAQQTNSQTSIPSQLNVKINTTGIFNTMERWVQKALTFVEDISVVTARPPLSDVEFRNYLDPAGILIRPRELRFACYHGGIEPSLRKVVWKHLLNVYPDGLTGNGRIDYIRNKAKDYYELRDTWKSAIQNGLVNEEILCISNMVRKDVLRTDRHLKFFAGHDDNPNIASLFNILTTFALNHPSVSYCQGMSDLASPLLVTMGDEAQAYICFCSVMERLSPHFNIDGLAMSLKFAHLSEALAYYDSFFWAYLKSVGADDLLFCYRWLLLEMKREFAFEDALKMMEVMWASLPYKPQDVVLYEVKYTGTASQSIPIPVPSLSCSYSKVCAIRRSSVNHLASSELRNRRFSRKQKASPHLSLDENSLASTTSSGLGTEKRKPFYSLDDTIEVLSNSDFSLIGSPFEILSLNSISNLNTTKPKLIKNLREFWQIGSGSTAAQSGESAPNSASSRKSANSTPTRDRDENRENAVFREEDENFTDEQFVFPNCSLETSCPFKSTTKAHPEGPPRNNRTNDHTTNHLTVDNRMGIMGEGRAAESASGSIAVFSDSENDSGHCGESLDLGNSLEDPEFQSGSSEANSSISVCKIPPPDCFGGGNPFLMFLCLTLLLQHRDHIIKNNMDYNETAMYFDKMVRKHNVSRVLQHAREMYSCYLKQTVVPRV